MKKKWRDGNALGEWPGGPPKGWLTKDQNLLAKVTSQKEGADAEKKNRQWSGENQRNGFFVIKQNRSSKKKLSTSLKNLAVGSLKDDCYQRLHTGKELLRLTTGSVKFQKNYCILSNPKILTSG